MDSPDFHGKKSHNKPQNMSLGFLGTVLICVSWFGFNMSLPSSREIPVCRKVLAMFVI